MASEVKIGSTEDTARKIIVGIRTNNNVREGTVIGKHRFTGSET